MTKSTHLSAVSALALGILTFAAVATAETSPRQGHDPRAPRGYQGGAITKGERAIIAKRRQRVKRLYRRAFRDDTLTRREAKKIKKARRRLHHTIDWARHNDWVRRHPRHRDRWTDRAHDRRWRHTDRYRRWWW